MSDITQDPEILDDDTEGVGDESAYDGEAVEWAEYDPAQFELPDDFEYTEDDDDN